MSRSVLRLLPLLGLALGCPGAPAVPREQDPRAVQLGTFNIDWLSAALLEGETPRTAVDYQMLGRLIDEHGLDVVGLQEIEGDAAMALLELPARYRWWVGASGWSQNPVLLWDDEQVELVEAGEVQLPGTGFPQKDPLWAHLRLRDPEAHGPAAEFVVVNVHFTPFEDDGHYARRLHQMSELAIWLDDGLPELVGPELAARVAVVGDFNDTFAGIGDQGSALAPLLDDERWRFATEDAWDFTNIPFRSTIDHIVLSEALTKVWPQAGQPQGCHVIAHDLLDPWRSYPGGYCFRQNLSSHRPVWLFLDAGAFSD